jgi:DNA ligase (NAD+)
LGFRAGRGPVPKTGPAFGYRAREAMSEASERRRIGKLRELLGRANDAYYVDNEPIMADSEFDARLAELIELERAHPELHDPNSPSQRVGGRPLDGFTTVRHAVRMMSIDNTYSLDDLRAWHDRVVKGLEAATRPG